MRKRVTHSKKIHQRTEKALRHMADRPVEFTVTELSQIESHLWEAANILRGPVDAADFKTYAFPLLFFKRISDVYDEEYQAALDEAGGDEEYARFPQNYRFQIPDGCHWMDVREVTPFHTRLRTKRG